MSKIVNGELTKVGLLSLLAATVLLVVWGLAIAAWGYAAIILPALALTFSALAVLVFITRG
ncbi:hypothetical protein [Cohaesibacter celericrescens]|uniref:Uncharacterized protein n=1 Tax=Cohaesibacter celericrescens TaxID=2067669 RepID=A0A2N5XSR4_9HYPH|nr:hypothetical protein [Cohaesibacter celericrescens]PLW77566.1 hypothetical protein C0081_09645 [Cohaesibacter celericrescens]